MSKTIIATLALLLACSVCLNLFQRRNQAVTCDNITDGRKAELLYKLGHKHLDADGDGIPCENLQNL